MISLYIVTLTLIVVFLSILLLKKKVGSMILPKWMTLTSILTFIIGLVLLLWQEKEINNELSKRNWTIAEGKIVESKIVGERALRTEVNYQYSVDDSIYSGISDFNIPGFGSKNYRRKNARIVKNDNPVGSKIKVYFNPKNPEISTLRYGPYWSNYMILGFGSFLLLIGMFVLGWQLSTKIKLKEN